jgi:hypothetical protein
VRAATISCGVSPSLRLRCRYCTTQPGYGDRPALRGPFASGLKGSRPKRRHALGVLGPPLADPEGFSRRHEPVRSPPHGFAVQHRQLKCARCLAAAPVQPTRGHRVLLAQFT